MKPITLNDVVKQIKPLPTPTASERKKATKRIRNSRYDEDAFFGAVFNGTPGEAQAVMEKLLN